MNCTPEGPDSASFSIFSLNLRFGMAADGPNNWTARKAGYPDLLNRHDVDFYCFQEANDFQTEDLKTILRDSRVIGQRTPSPRFWQNNVIFYRPPWECLFHDHFFLSHTPSIPSRFRESRWPRQCTLGIFSNGKARFVCITTHFDFSSEVQVMGARLILNRLDRLPRELPAVLCGDFNAEPASPCYAVFTGACPGNQDPSVAFKNVFPPPYPGTHHAFTGVPNGRHIDWILYRGPLIPTSAEVITKPYGGIYPSDHFPLSASFSF